MNFSTKMSNKESKEKGKRRNKSKRMSLEAEASPNPNMNLNNPSATSNNACIDEIDSYFCTLINQIHPDVYFAKNKSDILENIKEESDKERHEIVNTKVEKLRVPDKTRLFRKIDGSLMTVIEVYESFPSNMKKNALNNNNAGLTREKLLEKLHNKIATTSQKRNNLKRKHAEDNVKTKSKKKKENKRNWSLEEKLSRRNEMGKEDEDKKALPIQSSPQISFSKFNVSSYSNNIRQEKKKNKNMKGGKNKYEIMIKEVERKKEKLKEMKKNSLDKANENEDKEKWSSALMKAQGVKVKDDLSLLKKAVKKREKEKEKSRKNWQRKDAEQQERITQKQNKRTENIQQRKTAKLENKKKKAVKKGRIFIN